VRLLLVKRCAEVRVGQGLTALDRSASSALQRGSRLLWPDLPNALRVRSAARWLPSDRAAAISDAPRRHAIMTRPNPLTITSFRGRAGSASDQAVRQTSGCGASDAPAHGVPLSPAQHAPQPRQPPRRTGSSPRYRRTQRRAAAGEAGDVTESRRTVAQLGERHAACVAALWQGASVAIATPPLALCCAQAKEWE
jgi:hypothetical protein